MSPPTDDLERWRGQIDSFVNESRTDRAGIHAEIRALADRAEERHREVLNEIRDSSHATREAAHEARVEATSQALTAHRRADEAHSRLDKWEARAEGASWISKHMPAGLAAALSALATWWATGRPPGGN